MPWCDSCSSWHAPTAQSTADVCPNCGAAVDTDAHDDTQPATVGASAPWHFWLVVAALAGYLIWRLVQALVWAVT